MQACCPKVCICLEVPDHKEMRKIHGKLSPNTRKEGGEERRRKNFLENEQSQDTLDI